MSNRTIVAVEIGSSKIKGAVGTVTPDGILTVNGIEEERQPFSNYVRYGCVQNVKEVANVLNRIFMKLNNRISPAKISAVYVGVGGRSLMDLQRKIDIPLHEETEITADIVNEILGRAETMPDPDREVVEVVPGEFMVDNTIQPKPIGTYGSNISANVAVIYCRQQMLRNLSLSVSEKLGIKINGYVVRQTALADMVLTDEERELGVMLADCGAETTTVSVYKDGYLRSLVTVPLGSRHITRDIMSRNYSEERAEEIKRAVGNARPESQAAHQVRLDGIGDSEINNYVSARAGEIVVNINERITEAGLSAENLPAGIVVTGGGAQLNGFCDLLTEQTGLKVRKATVPGSVGMGNPMMHIADNVDVIALLHHLAQIPTAACVTLPAPPTPEPEPEPEDDTDPDDGKLVVEKVKTGGFFSKMGKYIKNVIDPDDDSGEEYGFDDEK